MSLPRVFGAEGSSNSGSVASDQIGLKNICSPGGINNIIIKNKVTSSGNRTYKDMHGCAIKDCLMFLLVDLKFCQLVLFNHGSSKLAKTSGDPVNHLGKNRILTVCLKCPHLVLLHDAFDKLSTLLHL